MARACWDAGTETFSAPCNTDQTTTYLNWFANKAVDTGGKDGLANTDSCTHTAGGAGTTDPWWYVDLGTAIPVHRLLIWNRIDYQSNSDRLKNFQVWVTNSNSPVFTDESLLCHSHGTDVVTTFAHPLNIICDLVGRYVWVRLPGTGKILTLCEVEIYEVAESAWSSNCDTDATCENTIGDFTCTCNDGYSGDGVT
eukprot:2847514-Rhodomonas_salina.1